MSRTNTMSDAKISLGKKRALGAFAVAALGAMAYADTLCDQPKCGCPEGDTGWRLYHWQCQCDAGGNSQDCWYSFAE